MSPRDGVTNSHGDEQARRLMGAAQGWGSKRRAAHEGDSARPGDSAETVA